MNWFLLIASSTFSSAIILYSLWPQNSQNVSRKIAVSLLVLSAFIFPAGYNYYLSDRSQESTAVGGALALEYPEIGEPKWTGPISRKPEPTPDQMSMGSVTARLEAKLSQNPDDIGGWILLGRSYVALGQPQRAMTLFEERLAANPDNIDLLLSYGETLTEFNQGNVSDKARVLFEKANGLEPSNPRVEYNLALYDLQQDQPQRALDRMNSLLENAPAGAPWLSQIIERRDAAAERLNITADAPSMKMPTNEQVRGVTAMSADDQNSFIRSMVDGLAEDLKENPDNLNGWLNLARSYGVLNEWQKSADAYKAASQLSPEDEDIKGLYKSALEKVTSKP